MASASAVECTATVAMPSSLQARSTRSAISPRLAMRIFSNIEREQLPPDAERRNHSMIISGSPNSTGWRVLDQDLHDAAGARRGNLVHGLHRLDDQQRSGRRAPGCRPRHRAARPAPARDRRCRPWARAPTPGCLRHRRRPVRRRADASVDDRGARRRTAATTGCAWRATRTRRPPRSNSISVRPVSSRSLRQLADHVMIDRTRPSALVAGFFRRRVPRSAPPPAAN